MKDLPLDRTALEHRSLEIGQAVEPGFQQSRQRAGDRDFLSIAERPSNL